jgi:RHS repeat-associated protein
LPEHAESIPPEGMVKIVFEHWALNDDRMPSQPNQVWAGDITYIPTAAGWLYHAVVIDLCSRRIVGWALADHLRASLVCDTLRQALGSRSIAPEAAGPIFHSDRGSQYGSGAAGTLTDTHFCLKDYLDPTALITPAAAVVERFSYDAFGPVRFMDSSFVTQSSSSYAWTFLFHAEFIDSESGLYNYGYRFYNPSLGRWLSRDPIGEDGGVNLYRMSHNNPVIFRDVLGLSPGPWPGVRPGGIPCADCHPIEKWEPPNWPGLDFPPTTKPQLPPPPDRPRPPSPPLSPDPAPRPRRQRPYYCLYDCKPTGEEVDAKISNMKEDCPACVYNCVPLPGNDPRCPVQPPAQDAGDELPQDNGKPCAERSPFPLVNSYDAQNRMLPPTPIGGQ